VTAADPLPQALMITAIVIGVSVTAVALTMFITMYHIYGTTNWGKIVRKRIAQKDD
jgi:multicomponent Na+:H+ antiporter subunit C